MTFGYKPHCFSHVDHAVIMLTSLHLHMKSSEVCIKTRSPPASLPIQDQVTKHTLKWPIGGLHFHHVGVQNKRNFFHTCNMHKNGS